MHTFVAAREEFEAVRTGKQTYIEALGARHLLREVKLSDQVRLVEGSNGKPTGRELYVTVSVLAEMGGADKGELSLTRFGFLPSSLVELTVKHEHDEEAQVSFAPPAPIAKRCKEVQELCSFFSYNHLPLELQGIVEPICSTLDILLEQVPDSEETIAGLRKMLEAKDCFVRAKLPQAKDRCRLPLQSGTQCGSGFGHAGLCQPLKAQQ